MLTSTAATSFLLCGNNRIHCTYDNYIQLNLEKIYIKILLQYPAIQHVQITCIVTHINCSTLTVLSASHDPYTHPHI